MCAAHAASGHGVKYLSGSIICLSVCLVVYGAFAIFVFILISSVEVQRHNACIPTLVSKGPQWGPVELICPSFRLYVRSPASFFVIIRASRNCAHRMRFVHPSISLSFCLVVQVAIWRSKRADHNCAQRMRPQAMGSNT